MFVEYTSRETVAHRLDPRTKLGLFAVVVVASLLFTHPLPNAVLASIGVALLAGLRVPWKGLAPLVRPLLPVLALIVLLAAMSYQPDDFTAPEYRRVIVNLWFDGGLPLTVGGLIAGSTLALRIVTMVAASSVLTACTSIEEFVAVLQKARMPFSLVFIVVTALRFVPTLQQRAQQVLNAQRARGARIDTGGPIRRVRAHMPVMVSLITDGIRMSETLAAAMLNRGYGATRRPTSLVVLQPRARDVGGSILAAGALAGALGAWLVGWGQL